MPLPADRAVLADASIAVLVFALGLLCSWAMWDALVRHGGTQLRLAGERAVDEVGRRLSDAERTHLDALARMAARWSDATRAPDPGLWVLDARHYVADHAALEDLGLVDAELRIVTTARGDRAHLHGQRYAPGSLRATLAAAARTSRSVQMHPRVPLLAGGEGMLVMLPLEREGRFDGLIVAVYRVPVFLGSVLDRAASEFGVQVALSGEQVFLRDADAAAGAPFAVEREVRTPWFTWQVRVTPRDALVRAYQHRLPDLVLGLGASFSAALGLVVWLLLLGRRQRHSLVAAHRRLQELFDNAVVLICAFDPQGRFVAVNAASRSILGYAPEELLGTDYAPLILAEDLPLARAEAAKVFGGGQSTDYELRFRRKDGGVIDMSWSSYWSERDGLVYGVGRDVTRRKRRDLLLAGLQTALADIVRGAPVQATLDGLCSLLERLFDGARPTVMRAEGGRLRVVVSRGLAHDWDRAMDGLPVGPQSGVCGMAAHIRAPRIVADVRADAACAPFLGLAEVHGVRACWSLPLLGGDGSLLGTFALYFANERSPTGDDLELLDGAAKVAELAFERERLDLALQRSARRLHDAAHIAHLGHWEFELARGVLHWSDEVFDIFGVRPEDFGHDLDSFWRHVHPDDRLAMQAAQEDVLAGRATLDLVHRIRREDGEVRWVHERAALEHGPDGQPVALVGTVQDVTSIRALEACITESEARHRLVIEQVGAIIYDYDVRSGHIEWAGAIGRLTGETPASMAALDIHGWEARIHPDDRANAMRELERSFAERRAYAVEYRFRRADGGYTWVRDEGLAYHDEQGAPQRMLGVLFDVGTRRALEELQAAAFAQSRRLNAELEAEVAARTAELQAANQELEAFAYSVSHDLRAPLRAIAGFADLLAREHAAQLDAQGQRFLQRVIAGTRRMSQLIDDLLDLSRVSRLTPERSRVDLSAMAERWLVERAEQEPERRVEWQVEEGLLVEGDPRLLQIAMDNLLGNAWKFSRGREVAHIRVGRETDASGATVYFVQDDGAGFDPRYADRLFGVFQRLHSEAEFPGTGIGLATVQRVIHRHGGRIWAEGRPDAGCTIRFTLA